MTNIIVTLNQTQGFCPEVGSFLEKKLGPRAAPSNPDPLCAGLAT